MPFNNNEYGLVFSGGGAKGAYQIGAWKALDKLGITPNIVAVSGSSVGALNALLFTSVSNELAESIWLSFTQDSFLYLSNAEKKQIKRCELENIFADSNVETNSILKRILLKLAIYYPNAVALIKILAKIYNSVIVHEDSDYIDLNNIARLIRYSISMDGFFSQDKIAEIIDQILNLRDTKYDPSIFVTVTRQEKDKPVFFKPTPIYINLTDMSDSDIKQYVLASSALPLIYPGKMIGNHEYYDGGFADNTPIKPLYDIGLRSFIVVYLDNIRNKDISKLIKEENTYFPDANIIRVIPDENFNDSIVATLSISESLTQKRINSGFNDAIRAFQN